MVRESVPPVQIGHGLLTDTDTAGSAHSRSAAARLCTGSDGGTNAFNRLIQVDAWVGGTRRLNQADGDMTRGIDGHLSLFFREDRWQQAEVTDGCQRLSMPSRLVNAVALL